MPFLKETHKITPQQLRIEASLNGSCAPANGRPAMMEHVSFGNNRDLPSYVAQP
jgi:hypothetical protein